MTSTQPRGRNLRRSVSALALGALAAGSLTFAQGAQAAGVSTPDGSPQSVVASSRVAASGTAAAARGATLVAGPTVWSDTAYKAAYLSYTRADRTPADVQQRLVRYQNGTPVAGAWLFDATVLLAEKAPTGVDLAYGTSNKGDWDATLASFLGAPGNAGDRGQAGVIDAAISANASRTSTSGTPLGVPATKQQIIITVPWLSTASRTFGVVGGVSRNPAKPADADAIVADYVDQVAKRFAEKGFSNLALWGVYFMREETVPSDVAWRRTTQSAAHARGLRTLWIPYRDAPGLATWRSDGVDVAHLQSGYVYNSPYYGGTASKALLDSTADAATRLGMTPEIELGYHFGDVVDAGLSRQVLSAGDRLGYRTKGSAWFVGAGDGGLRESSPLYGSIAAYLLGGDVSAPDVPLSAGTSRTLAASTGPVVETTYTSSGALPPALSVTFAAGWSGSVSVVGRDSAGTTRQLGWAAAAGVLDPSAKIGAVSVPLTSAAAGNTVTVQLKSAPGAPAASGVKVTADGLATTSLDGRAPLAVTSASWTAPAPRYPDSNPQTLTGWARGKLTDGVVSNRWAPGNVVGWKGSRSPALISVDLGAVRALNSVSLHVVSTPVASTSFPSKTPVGITAPANCPLLTDRAPGSTPCAAESVVLTGSAPQGLTTAADYTKASWITFATPNGSAVRTRYVTLSLESFWLAADELKVVAGGVDISSAVSYRLLSAPSADDRAGYGDTGRLLVDGAAGTMGSSFRTELLTGWQGRATHTVTVDAGAPQSASLDASFAVDQNSGIAAPATVSVQFSLDGGTWSAPVSAAATRSAVGSGYAVLGASPQGSWRYARLAITGGHDYGWVMPSEIATR